MKASNALILLASVAAARPASLATKNMDRDLQCFTASGDITPCGDDSIARREKRQGGDGGLGGVSGPGGSGGLGGEAGPGGNGGLGGKAGPGGSGGLGGIGGPGGSGGLGGIGGPGGSGGLGGEGGPGGSGGLGGVGGPGSSGGLGGIGGLGRKKRQDALGSVSGLLAKVNGGTHGSKGALGGLGKRGDPLGPLTGVLGKLNGRRADGGGFLGENEPDEGASSGDVKGLYDGKDGTPLGDARTGLVEDSGKPPLGGLQGLQRRQGPLGPVQGLLGQLNGGDKKADSGAPAQQKNDVAAAPEPQDGSGSLTDEQLDSLADGKGLEERQDPLGLLGGLLGGEDKKADAKAPAAQKNNAAAAPEPQDGSGKLTDEQLDSLADGKGLEERQDALGPVQGILGQLNGGDKKADSEAPAQQKNDLAATGAQENNTELSEEQKNKLATPEDQETDSEDEPEDVEQQKNDLAAPGGEELDLSTPGGLEDLNNPDGSEDTE